MFSIKVEFARSIQTSHIRERPVFGITQKSSKLSQEIMTPINLGMSHTFSGQPRAENGNRAEENQVSRTSTSWHTLKMSDSRTFSFAAAFCLASLTLRAATQILECRFMMLEHSYTGIWCPHHS
jgi:hypothetical protein